MSEKIKQVIVMRTKYPKGGIRKGKMIAQGAHASMMFLTMKIRNVQFKPIPYEHEAGLERSFYGIYLNREERAWVEGNFAKICLQVDTEEDLNAIEEKAREAGLEVNACIDSGLTEFDGIPTKTALAIGPDESSKIDAITGNLKPL